MSAQSIRGHLEECSFMLRQSGIKDAELDARLLLQHVIGCGHGELISRYSNELPATEAEVHLALVRRRAGGEPVFRIIGQREFHGNLFQIGPDVLDPRPETELLVDEIVADVDTNAELHFADLGTGSGAIGVSLLKLLPRSNCTAIDISQAALEIASSNAIQNDVAIRFDAVQSDFFAALDEVFDFIVSNPPYIRKSEMGKLDVEVRLHDPLIALDGGTDGLDAYRAIFSNADKYLRTNGKIYVEIGADQLDSCAELAENLGWNVVRSKKDYAGLPRILVFERAENQSRQQDVHNVRRKSLESGIEPDSFMDVQGQRL